MEITRGYEVKGKSRGKLKHWTGLLDEWSVNIERYIKITNGDAPYWYKERANVSVLAGAAWRSGLIALQEFEATKQTSEGSEQALYWKGRCDLYIGSAENHHDLVEAKYKWLSLSSGKFVDNANTLLDKALFDAQNSKCGQDVSAIGVAFIALYAHEKHLETINDLIVNIIEEVSTMGLDAYAWSFPAVMRKKVLDNNYINPGMLLLVKVAN